MEIGKMKKRQELERMLKEQNNPELEREFDYLMNVK
jgi:hypothetical protein